ncbi:MAG: ABC transporter permease [Candidatus Diapherotrites archaeon]|nr:ABC transporter permease [Candidatus Diapherotrites archaeon]
MDKILTIAKQEFKTNVRRKGYLLFTLVLPISFVMLAGMQALFGAEVPQEIVMQRSLETPIPLPMLIPSIFGAIFALVIFISAGYLLYGMVEEKENRLIEILLTSVSTRQLLVGKTLGLGLLGIGQLGAWLISISIATVIMPELLWMAHIPEVSIISIALIVLLFVLGYFLFAFLIAGIGSMLSDTRQANQISGIVTMVSLIPSWAAIFFFQNPNSAIPVILSYIPITAPITLVIRLLMTEIPILEITLSIALTLFTVLIIIAVVTKKLKGHLLYYEKKLEIIG